jgi:hypothetical protein
VLDQYEAKFVTAANSSYARRLFREAKQQSDESLVAWHTRLQMLYRRSNPLADVEHTVEVREKFIEGLIHPVIKEFVMDTNPETMSRALVVATAKAGTLASMERDKGHHRRTTSSHNIFAMDGFNSNEDGDKGPMNAMTRRCYVCQSEDHLQRECPQRKARGDRRPGRGGRRPSSGGGSGFTNRKPGAGRPSTGRRPFATRGRSSSSSSSSGAGVNSGMAKMYAMLKEVEQEVIQEEQEEQDVRPSGN